MLNIFSLVVTPLLLTSVVSTQSSNLSVKNNVSVKINGEETQQVREEVHLRYEQHVQNAKQEFEQKRTELKLHFEGTKDQVRAQVTERLFSNIQDINQKWVAKYNEALTRLTQILDKAETAGADSTKVADARQKIADAQDTVNTQAAKVYEFNIADDQNLGQIVSGEVTQLREDLKTVQNSVLAAKEAVREAIASIDITQNEE
jgi:hypothetical protein